MPRKKSNSDKIEVTRKWKTKSGEIREVTYLYPRNKEIKREVLLVYKSGKRRGMLRESRVKDVYEILVKGDYIQDDGSLNEKKLRYQEVRQSILNLIRRSEQEKRTLTVERAVASYTKNRIAGMIINAGYSVEEFADKYQVSPKDLLNSDYWTNVGDGEMEFKLPGWDEPKKFEWANYYVGASSFVSK